MVYITTVDGQNPALTHDKEYMSLRSCRILSISRSIPIIKTQYIHSPIFRRRPIYTHQNGNINPTSCHYLFKPVTLTPNATSLNSRTPDFQPLSLPKSSESTTIPYIKPVHKNPPNNLRKLCKPGTSPTECRTFLKPVQNPHESRLCWNPPFSPKLSKATSTDQQQQAPNPRPGYGGSSAPPRPRTEGHLRATLPWGLNND